MKLWFLLILGVLLSASANLPPRQYYADIPFNSREDLERIVNKGYDVGGVNYEKKRITLIVHESDMEGLRSEQVLDKRAIPLAPDALFKKPEQVVSFLIDRELKYPHLASLEVIGKSTEGRDIYAIKLTARFVVSPTPKPVLLIDAMHHAREVMTPEVALDIVDYLTKNYETDPDVRKWMNDYVIWVVPMLNPDGNNKVWNSQSMWRKNTRNGHGVDINRNYDYDFGKCQGSSSSTSSDIYRGTAPASEPETQAITALATRIKPKFAISYHSFSEIVIYPFGCSPKKIPDADRTRYEGIGSDLAKKLVRDSGSGGYDPGTSYELLYNVDGGSIDWMYNTLKTYAFVIEINSTEQGFQPSYKQWRDITVERQREGWKFILNKMGETH